MMERKKFQLYLRLVILFGLSMLGAGTIWANHEYVRKHTLTKTDAKHILTSIEIDMALEDVTFILGNPDRQKNSKDRKMSYGRLRIVFSAENRVRQITYDGRCGLVTVKNRDFNILINPKNLRRFVIEALSRNDLLCPGHTFERRIGECISEIMTYVRGA